MIPSLCLLAGLTVGFAQPAPPPLTEEQVTKVRALVKTHQEEQAALKEKLEAAQKKLADCYSRFDLDEDAVKKLHAEILDTQGKLLHGYHTMQKELRSIVGPERFVILSKRIDNALRNPPEKKTEPKK